MGLVKTLRHWYGRWCLRDEKKIMEMWIWPRMKRIRWREKLTDDSILQGLGINYLDTFANVNDRTLSTFDQTMAARLLKLVEGYLEGSRRRS